MRHNNTHKYIIKYFLFKYFEKKLTKIITTFLQKRHQSSNKNKNECH